MTDWLTLGVGFLAALCLPWAWAVYATRKEQRERDKLIAARRDQITRAEREKIVGAQQIQERKRSA